MIIYGLTVLWTVLKQLLSVWQIDCEIVSYCWGGLFLNFLINLQKEGPCVNKLMPKLHNEFARIVLKSIENGKFLSLALNISKNV